MPTFDAIDTPICEEAPTVGDTLSWPDRIKNYRQVIRRAAYVSYEDGWAHGLWFLGNSWAVKSGYYGGYPQGYLKRLRALFPDKPRVLHLFSGKVNTTEFPGDTCDVNATLEPTFIADAHELTGVPIEEYDLIVADPAIQCRRRRPLWHPAGQSEQGGGGAGAADAAGRTPCAARPSPADVSQGPVAARGGDRRRPLHHAPLPLPAHLASRICGG